MVFVDAQLLGHLGGYLLTVAGEHHHALHAQLLQLGNGCRAGLFHAVVNHNVTGIFAIHRHVNNGTCQVTIVPPGTHTLHHFGVAHAHPTASHQSLHPVAGHLLHLGDFAAVGGLVGEGVSKSRPHGMGGEVLHMGGEVQQLPLVEHFGMYRLHGKLPVGEGASFVEHHRAHLRQHIHIVGSLDEDAVARSAADAAKEGERHADHQRAGARNHQEEQCPIEPHGKRLCKAARKQRGQQCQCHRREDHHGGIYPRKAGDEGFAFRLMLVGALHQVDDLRHGAFAKTLGGAHPNETRHIHATRNHLVAHPSLAGHAFASKSHSVEGGGALENHAVQRHLFSGTNHNGLPHSHLIGAHGQHFAVAFHIGRIGSDVHKVLNAVATLALGVALKQLANLEKEHHKHRFGELRLRPREETDAQRADGSHAHQEVLVEGVSVGQSLGRLFQGVETDEEIGHEIDQQQLPGVQRSVFLNDHRRHQHDNGDEDFHQLLL